MATTTDTIPTAATPNIKDSPLEDDAGILDNTSQNENFQITKFSLLSDLQRIPKFAQMREDPYIELSVLAIIHQHYRDIEPKILDRVVWRNIYSQIANADCPTDCELIGILLDYQAIKILCIASAGDTALALMRPPYIMDIVDSNQTQIYLAMLKHIIGQMYTFPNEYICALFSANELPSIESVAKYISTKYSADGTNIQQLTQMLEWYKYIRPYAQLLGYGLSSLGEYETCWKAYLAGKYISKNYLRNVFGANAVDYSSRDFHTKLTQIYTTLKYAPDLECSEWFKQIIYGVHSAVFLKRHRNIFHTRDTDSIKYTCADINSFLDNTQHNQYDLITLSNITDWMSIEAIDILLNQIYQHLRQFGFVVLRRFHSDNSLMTIIQHDKKWIIHDLTSLEATSYYEECLALQKIS